MVIHFCLRIFPNLRCISISVEMLMNINQSNKLFLFNRNIRNRITASSYLCIYIWIRNEYLKMFWKKKVFKDIHTRSSVTRVGKGSLWFRLTDIDTFLILLIHLILLIINKYILPLETRAGVELTAPWEESRVTINCGNWLIK